VNMFVPRQSGDDRPRAIRIIDLSNLGKWTVRPHLPSTANMGDTVVPPVVLIACPN